jgi:outer membrane protein assembly factor BamE
MRILSSFASNSDQATINVWLNRALLCCLAAGLCACATKRNPLIDEPQAVAKAETAAKVAPAVAPAATAAKPAAVATTATPATASPLPSGVQVTAAPTGFNRFLAFLKPYRIDVQQGNFISQEMVAQLKPGQTRDQVRFILGTPLVADPFHASRWDYTFRLQKNRGETTTSHVAVFFTGDKLERFTNIDLPTEQDYIARIAGPALKDTRVQPEPIQLPAK